MTPRPLNVIASEIKYDWKKINPYAKPYLDAMFCLHSVKDSYILDSGSEIVARFLANASSWRGDTARRVKKELNDALAELRRS